MMFLTVALTSQSAEAPAEPATGATKSSEIPEKLRQIMAEDDNAAEEIDGWIRESMTKKEDAQLKQITMNTKIRERLQKVEDLYIAFLESHPENAEALLAYGSFLNEQGRNKEAQTKWEKAKEVAPENPAVWNNLASHYSHTGETEKVFAYLEKAIELDQTQSVYYHNLAIMTYTMRKDAKLFYGTTDENVIFDKSLDLYRKALDLDPKNFELAADYAQSYYGIKPVRVEEALGAWTRALSIADEEPEKEGVYIHLARFEIMGKNFAKARDWLTKVKHPFYNDLKKLILRNIEDKESDLLNTLGGAN